MKNSKKLIALVLSAICLTYACKKEAAVKKSSSLSSAALEQQQLATCSFNSDSSALYGSWRFTRLQQINYDESGNVTADFDHIVSGSLCFKGNGKFEEKFNDSPKEFGKWYVTDSDCKLVLKWNDGRITAFNIIKIDDNNLIFGYGGPNDQIAINRYYKR